jgi:protein-disulfide isomerase
MNKFSSKIGSIAIFAAVFVAIIGVSLAVYYGIHGNKNVETPKSGLSAKVSTGLEEDSAFYVGDKNAKVTIVDFFDFQCPACAIFFATVEPELISKYVDTGKARIIYKPLHFIDSFNGNLPPQESYNAALSYECSADQGKSIEMHNAIFNQEVGELQAQKTSENNGDLNKAFFESTVKNLGMDLSKFRSCVSSDKYAEKINQYTTDAGIAMSGKISTPTLFINGVKMGGVQRIEDYSAIIDVFLNK